MRMRSPLFGLQMYVVCLKLPQGLYYMSANRIGSGETALMRRLAYAGRLCDKNHFLMCWHKIGYSINNKETMAADTTIIMSAAKIEPQHEKPYLLTCAPEQRLKSACVLALSDQNLRCPHEKTASKMCSMKILIRPYLNIRWAYMSEVTLFSDVEAHFSSFALKQPCTCNCKDCKKSSFR